MQYGLAISHCRVSQAPCNRKSHALRLKGGDSGSRLVGSSEKRLPAAPERWLLRYTLGQRYIGCTLCRSTV